MRLSFPCCFFSQRYLFSGRTPGFLFHGRPGGRGLWWRRRRADGGEREEERGGRGGGAVLARPSRLPLAHAHPPWLLRTPPSPQPSPPREKPSLKLLSPLRRLLPNLSKERPHNYTLRLYNKCSHIMTSSRPPVARGGGTQALRSRTGGDTESGRSRDWSQDTGQDGGRASDIGSLHGPAGQCVLKGVTPPIGEGEAWAGTEAGGHFEIGGNSLGARRRVWEPARLSGKVRNR